MAKIQFDIKFRPQIESGEYKVQTRDERKARIVCWDRKDSNRQIVALVENNKEQEIMYLFNLDGRTLENYTSDSDLLIVTPEPELTEFEKTIKEIIGKYAEREMGNEAARAAAEMLISSAKRELCKGCAANLEGYIKGREDARKEMEENRVYKYEGPTIPAFSPPCYYGGECTNPSRDCIHCPRLSLTGINTTTGTSTSKVEGK